MCRTRKEGLPAHKRTSFSFILPYYYKFRKLNIQEIKELKGDITPLCSVRS